ncbi:hypothetical protein KKH18_09945 [bacterium]|nr:hypothetical protein [bacterium]
MRYLPLLLCLLLAGCMSPYKRVSTHEEPMADAQLLSRFLDRSGSWESFSCRVKVRLEIGDTTVSAKGTLLYMSPEKYSLSFVKPYHQVIGDIYVTASQLLYWGNGKTKYYYSAVDTVHIPELIPMAFPDWDPRDLLPFPVSGRTAGFQVISEQQDSIGQHWIHGDCGSARHDLRVDPFTGVIRFEQVVRNATDPVRKFYDKYYSIQGWPIPARVTCEDTSGRVRMTWSISQIDLKSPDFTFEESETSQ